MKDKLRLGNQVIERFDDVKDFENLLKEKKLKYE